ncbi:MAG: cytochrome P450 [Anaerolineae bacterium]
MSRQDTAKMHSLYGDWLGVRALRYFRRAPLDFLTELASSNGDVTRFRLGPFPCYLVASPAGVHQVYVEQASRFHKTRLMKEVFRPSLGESLLTSDGDFWLRQRRLIQPAFHSKRIESYGQIMVEYTLRELSGWRDGQERELHEDMMRLTMAIVSKSLFDIDVGDEANEIGAAISVAIEIANTKFGRLFQIPRWLPTPENRRERAALAKIDTLVRRFIQERRAVDREQLARRNDLLSMLLLAANEDGAGGMTNEQARNEICTLFLAGHETTAVTLSWACYLLAQHPEAQARLRQEVRSVSGSRPPTVQDLPDLAYTRMVIQETLRLYPPAWITPREAQQDVQIGSQLVPRGAVVFVSPWVSHRDERHFPGPDKFLPERWTDEFEKQLPKGAYIPFAAGPRVCIGNAFALMEARLILAAIVQRFELELAPGQSIQPEPLVTLRPNPGVRVRLRAQTL